VPVRYAGKLWRLRLRHFKVAAKPDLPVTAEIVENGFAPGPTGTPQMVKALQNIYVPRVPAEKPAARNSHPFINLVKPEDLTADNPLVQLAFSPEVLDVAMDYFGGNVLLDSLQILNSFATEEDALKESQKWHLDYGDSRSLHCVMYLNDVMEPEDGPFVFIDKKDTKRLGRSLIIRRIEDTQFSKEVGGGQVRELYGEAGTSVLVDPAVCYHYGSRCKKARLAVFITFNTDAPFVKAIPIVRNNAEKLLAAGKKLRPDLDDGRLDRLLGLGA
tara:strand:+ start:1589 stop:2407 length:819 start_codon:yes stop_codon:yes gene_type:complete